MSDSVAYLGASVFDGTARHEDAALVVRNGRVAAICPRDGIDRDARRIEIGPGLIAPGFVDLQVNGGGGVLFNEMPTPEGIRAICAAHARAGGSTALLPTVITDRPAVTFAALDAVAKAMANGVPGCAGIHLEGPFIAPARKGAHDPALIRAMSEEDLERIASSPVRPLLITVAPESVSNAQIARLAAAGILVSLGHTDCDYDTAMAAFAAGASTVTHLFNAMSPLSHRAPGLVGAALDAPDIACGFIADGHHVHPAVLRAALRAKAGPARMLAVSDAMPTVGSAHDVFTLNGREARREDGRLTLEDGTLAGSDLSMVAAVRTLVKTLGVPLPKALAMASLHPARHAGLADRGHLEPGARADFVHLDVDLALRGTFIAGASVEGQAAG